MKANPSATFNQFLKMLNSKSEFLNPKQIQNYNVQNKKYYDLEDRTLEFAKKVRVFVKKLPRTISNFEDGRQLIKSSGSIGSNYIEANESFSKKDFRMRIKISRKEAKESRYWLRLVEVNSTALEEERENLITEATEVMKIFGSMVEKTK